MKYKDILKKVQKLQLESLNKEVRVNITICNGIFAVYLQSDKEVLLHETFLKDKMFDLDNQEKFKLVLEKYKELDLQTV